MWQVEFTDPFGDWWATLSEEEQESVASAVEFLEEHGPTLGRPFVDTLSGSRFANLKELRPMGGNLRILFVFDPRRIAVLLLGGDKTGNWSRWYKRAIPEAERLFDEHLRKLRSRGGS